jgi:hypothetical protein
MKSKKKLPIWISVLSGDKEFLSFKASDFNNEDEINSTLNSLVNLITSVLISSGVSSLSFLKESGSHQEILAFVNGLFDEVQKHTRKQIAHSLKHFSQQYESDFFKGGDA